jgi:hypothetical protein
MTTYTVYDTQDSSWNRDGLTEPAARELLAERNRENSRHGDRYAMLTDAEFEAQEAANIKALADGRTVNGRDAVNAEVFAEGGYWRWRITDNCGVEFLDGANYRTREQAAAGLVDALDPV